jgi:hypothetical protein
LAAIHTHIEGAVALEGEAAFGGVELVGGDAEVEQDAIDQRDAAFGQHGGEFPEIAAHGGEAGAELGEVERGFGEGVGIAVQADDFSALFEEKAGVSSASEGAIEEQSSGARAEVGHHFAGEDWRMVTHGRELRP